MSVAKQNKTRFAKLNPSLMVSEQELLTQIEYVQAKRKLQQFASFLPDEILRFHGNVNQMSLYHHFVGVLLCIDASDIFDLILKHFRGQSSELYMLSVNLNAYLGSIIEVVRCYGGDVIDLMGTNCVTMWKCPPDGIIHEVLHTAIVCASVLQELLGIYTTDMDNTIRLKTIITCGNVSYGIFGNHNIKKAVFIGDAFKSMRSLLSQATYNAVIVGRTSYPHMIRDRYAVVEYTAGYLVVEKISYLTGEADVKSHFEEKYLQVSRLVIIHLEQRMAMKSLLMSSRLVSNVKMHVRFVKMLPPREELSKAGRYWTVQEMKALQNEIVFEHLCDSQPGDYLTEMKEVTCMYIKVSPDSDVPAALLPVVDEVFAAVVGESWTLQCIVQHVYVLEIGIMVRILFGLRFGNPENESALALQLGRKLKQLLETRAQLVSVSVGISVGTVFCSAIGHPLRREYSIIGEPISKARRLAILGINRVLCDLRVFNNAKLSAFYFKWFKKDININEESEDLIEYNETFDTNRISVGLFPLIDRTAEYNRLVAMVKHPETVGYSGALLKSVEKLGKTTLLVHLREAARERDCSVVFVTLAEAFRRPYYCIAEVYRQIYDQVYTIYEDLNDFIDLPRDLVNFVGAEENTDEDIALQKYRTLNRFRDLVSYSTRIIVIFIDNFQQIDVQSWEILELTFPQENLRLIVACNPDKMQAALMQRVRYIKEIRELELHLLKERHIGPLVCSMLQAEGVSQKLITLIAKICDGNAGYVEVMLLRMLNNDAIRVHFSAREWLNPETYYYKDLEQLKRFDALFTIVDFSVDKVMEYASISVETIYGDVFNSLPLFLQLIVKSASVIGTQFGRQLLRLAMNLPDEADLSLAIKMLFEKRIFQCASLLASQKQVNPSLILCGCPSDELADRLSLPKYAYCKLMYFRNERLRAVAYNKLPENHRHELHVLCAQVLEKTAHICPSCLRNPSNYYAFFGHYDEFLEFCNDPTASLNYNSHAKRSFENIKPTIHAHVQANIVTPTRAEEGQGDTRKWADVMYLPVRRHFNAAECHCIEMLHVIYRDLIRHATHTDEISKVIFYKLKFGLIQMCMRDITGAMETLHETRESSLVDCGLKDDKLVPLFRKYHVGKASMGLAICNLKLSNIAAAKSNILLALRQYNVPLVAFSFKHFRWLLRRCHRRLNVPFSYGTTRDALGWELGNALFIAAKIFALENNWGVASDCCRFGFAMMKDNNRNVGILLDTYCLAVKVYSISGNLQTCERLQKYIVREFQEYYALNDTFFFHMLLDMLNIIIELNVAKGELKTSISLGYRFCHLAEQSSVLQVQPSVLLLLCELNMYDMSFRHLVDMVATLRRYLSLSHQCNLLYYYIMCLHIYICTGFHVLPIDDIIEFARSYFENATHHITRYERIFKLLIQIYLLRCNRFEQHNEWHEEMDFSTAVLSNFKIIKILLFQLEVHIFNMMRSIRWEDNIREEQCRKDIRAVAQHLKEGVKHNVLYRPAYYALHAWYLIVSRKKKLAGKRIVKMYNVADKYNIAYFKAFAIRLKNHWEGGFALEYELRPRVALQAAPTFSMLQFIQFLHPYPLW